MHQKNRFPPDRQISAKTSDFLNYLNFFSSFDSKFVSFTEEALTYIFWNVTDTFYAVFAFKKSLIDNGKHFAVKHGKLMGINDLLLSCASYSQTIVDHFQGETTDDPLHNTLTLEIQASRFQILDDLLLPFLAVWNSFDSSFVACT